jgi:hypothetical protein
VKRLNKKRHGYWSKLKRKEKGRNSNGNFESNGRRKMQRGEGNGRKKNVDDWRKKGLGGKEKRRKGFAGCAESWMTKKWLLLCPWERRWRLKNKSKKLKRKPNALKKRFERKWQNLRSRMNEKRMKGDSKKKRTRS